MAHGAENCLASLAILLLIAITQCERFVETAVFLSPKFVLEPGSVFENTFYNIDFPRGHIAIKSFDAEIVDRGGNPVSLHETYLHHWLPIRYYARKGSQIPNLNDSESYDKPAIIIVKNKGLCDSYLVERFGLGSESRKTETYVPDPYGVEVGNPSEIPEGYEERWMLDIHAIDTRGVDDRLGCIECRCDLYNVTKDSGYKGGSSCCYNKTKCKSKNGFQDTMAVLFLKYTVKYVNWDNTILPVGIYILDVTTTSNPSNRSGGLPTHQCQVEYDIMPCSASANNDDCIDSKNVSLSLPIGGDLILATARQHTGAIGSTIHGKDGRILCSSVPIYGEGTEPGNEAGYIVGMSTCYPKPGSVKISAGESLTIVSNYSSTQMHTGVMGLFYLIIAESTNPSVKMPKKSRQEYLWFIVLPGVAAILAIIVGYQRKCKKDGYRSLRI